MATAAEAQELVSAASCDFCTIPPGLILYAVLAALIDVSNGDAVSTDPQVIINEARCLECVIPQGLVPYAILEAVRDVAANAGGGQQVYQDRATPPDDPTLPAISFPTGGGLVTQWDVASQAWV